MDNTEIYKETIAKLLKETDDIVFEIRSLNRDNRNTTRENDITIAKLQKKLLETETTMEKALTESKEEAIKPKCGWAHFKAMKDKIVIKDVDKTIEEIKVKLPSFVDDLIKYVETYSIRRDKLNKLVKDKPIRIQVLETVIVETQNKKFEYKFTGGE